MITKTQVSGNLGRFELDQVLTDRKDIAEYYRLSVNEGADRETTLTDAQILEIIDKVNISDIVDGDINSDIDVRRTEALEAVHA